MLSSLQVMKLEGDTSLISRYVLYHSQIWPTDYVIMYMAKSMHIVKQASQKNVSRGDVSLSILQFTNFYCVSIVGLGWLTTHITRFHSLLYLFYGATL